MKYVHVILPSKCILVAVDTGFDCVYLMQLRTPLLHLPSVSSMSGEAALPEAICGTENDGWKSKIQGIEVKIQRDRKE